MKTPFLWRFFRLYLRSSVLPCTSVSLLSLTLSCILDADLLLAAMSTLTAFPWRFPNRTFPLSFSACLIVGCSLYVQPSSPPPLYR